MIADWISFARPAWLLALLPLAAMAWRNWRTRDAATPWRHVIDAHLLPYLLDAGSAPSRRAFLAFVFAALCAVLALSGPRLHLASTPATKQRLATHVLVIDLSPSAAPRLERVKAKLNALLRGLDGAEVALLVYAEEPYLVVPPTTDADVVARFIPELATDAMPVAGNRPESALRMALSVLERSAAPVRSVVWISSGTTSAPLPRFPDGIRLFALHGGAETDHALKAIVQRSGGMLQQMRSDDSDVKTLAAALATRKQMALTQSSSGGIDIGFWFLLPLLPLAALQMRQAIAAWLPFLLCAGIFVPPAEAARLADIEGQRLFGQGRHVEAAARFADARWKAAAHYRAGQLAEAVRLLEGIDEPDAHYNRGNALAKLGYLQEALDAYESSLRVRPNDADTLHNRDLVRRLLDGRSGGGGGGGNSNQGGQGERGAAQVAEQWLRSVPDEPATLLRRKLQLEHRRREAGEARRAW